MGVNNYITKTGKLIPLNPSTSSISNTVPDTSLSNMIDFAEYGGKYNDSTFDNKPLLTQAMNELASKGGGTVYFPKNGSLYFTENIIVPSGVSLLGAPNKTKFILKSTVKNYWTFLHLDNKRNIKVENLILDSNRDNRETAGNLGDLTGGTSPQIGISMANRSKNITIQNCEIYGNGVWLLSCHTGGEHPSNIKIRDCYFNWKMGYASPDKPFTEGVTVDNTLIYFDAIDYIFENNVVETSTGSANMTGIEVHGARGIVKNNTFKNVRTGCIPWNMVNDYYGAIDNNHIISDNKFLNVLNGFDVGLSPTRNFNGLTISGNYILLDPNKFPNPKFSRGIILGVWNAKNGETSKNFKIIGNTIEGVDYTINHSDPSVYYNFYGIGVMSGVYSNLLINNNTLNNLPSFGLYGLNEFQKALKVNSAIIQGNMITDAGKSQQNRPSNVTAIYFKENASSDLTGVQFMNNGVHDTKPNGTYYSSGFMIPDKTSFQNPMVTDS
ncbi:hypothetical protein [Ignavigranum ruoffiae]|uniref:hypothetical protein n=1 Tax=Ignavigranum ruoffiae TaxID=89093 RepID=UPI0023571AD2|nr:hypothetical protein [Ignavigranum ruoffiae]